MYKKYNFKRENTYSGTVELGLYINSIIYGIEYENTEIDEKLRNKLEKEAKEHGLEKLYERACKIDEQAM